MIGTIFFVRMCKIDVPEGTESLVPLSLFVWKIFRKNEREALNSPPPPVSRGLKCMSTYLVRASLQIRAAGCFSVRFGHPSNSLTIEVI